MLIYLQTIESEEDKSKFEQIYAHYRGLMFYIANGILHNEQDAEDAVHQAFVNLAENIEKISDPMCPKTKSYIAIIVEHTAIDGYRKKSKRATLEFHDETPGLTVSAPECGGLAAAILRLPQRDRAVLLLRYDNGYTSKEVAQILGLSFEAERKAEQRAKSKLKELLEKEGISI